MDKLSTKKDPKQKIDFEKRIVTLQAIRYERFEGVIRRVGTIFEYVVAKNSKLYSENFNINPRLQDKILYHIGFNQDYYSEQKIKEIIMFLVERSKHLIDVLEKNVLPPTEI